MSNTTYFYAEYDIIGFTEALSIKEMFLLKHFSFSQAVKAYFKKTFDYKGRATRSEYWFALLFIFLSSLGLAILALAILSALLVNSKHPENSNTGIMVGSFLLLALVWVTFFPLFALSFRRLREVGLKAPATFLLYIALIFLNVAYYFLRVKKLYVLYYSSQSPFRTNPIYFIELSLFLSLLLLMIFSSLKADTLTTQTSNLFFRTTKKQSS